MYLRTVLFLYEYLHYSVGPLLNFRKNIISRTKLSLIWKELLGNQAKNRKKLPNLVKKKGIKRDLTFGTGFVLEKNSTSKEDGGLHGGYGLRLAPLQTMSHFFIIGNSVGVLPEHKLNIILTHFRQNYNN